MQKGGIPKYVNLLHELPFLGTCFRQWNPITSLLESKKLLRVAFPNATYSALSHCVCQNTLTRNFTLLISIFVHVGCNFVMVSNNYNNNYHCTLPIGKKYVTTNLICKNRKLTILQNFDMTCNPHKSILFEPTSQTHYDKRDYVSIHFLV